MMHGQRVRMEHQEIANRVMKTIKQYSAVHEMPVNEDFVFRKLREEMVELDRPLIQYKQVINGSRPAQRSKSELADEMADVLGMLIVCGYVFEIDLLQALDKKWFSIRK